MVNLHLTRLTPRLLPGVRRGRVDRSEATETEYKGKGATQGSWPQEEFPFSVYPLALE